MIRQSNHLKGKLQLGRIGPIAFIDQKHPHFIPHPEAIGKGEDGGPAPVYSIASGLDYPSVGPEHAFWKDLGRVKYTTVSDAEAIDAFFKLSRYEGVIPALESAHAIACAMRWAAEHPYGSIVATCSGRGDKDLDYVIENYGFGEEYRFDDDK